MLSLLVNKNSNSGQVVSTLKLTIANASENPIQGEQHITATVVKPAGTMKRGQFSLSLLVPEKCITAGNME